MMKTNADIEKKFDAVTFMRQQRERISKETEGMTFAQIKRYLEDRHKRGNVKSPPQKKK